MPTVYFHPVSQPSRAIHWYVARHKIPNIDFKVVDILSGENRAAEYSALTRQYQAVPVLDVDGEVLTESGAILTYLAKQNGNKDLPTDPVGEARVLEAMLHHDGLGRNVTKCVMKALFAKKAHPALTLDAQRNIVDKEVLFESLEFVDGILSTWKFIAGKEFTLADYLVAAELTQLDHMKPVLPDNCTLEKFPNLVRYLDDLKGLEGFDAFVAPTIKLAGLIAEANEK